MIDTAMMFRLGVPRIRKIMGAAMKAANIAVADGRDPETVQALVSKLVRSEDPENEPMDELAELFAPLAKLLKDNRAGRTYFKNRPQPAPWKNWAKGDLEDSAIEQMHNACRLPVAVGGALMPDAHTGYGLPIGGVLAVKNAVIPYAVGVDIACRMRLTILDLPFAKMNKESDRLAQALEAETRFGMGACFDAGQYRTHPVMALDWSITPPTYKMYRRASAQLGTSGSGNHFVEFGKLTVPADIDEPTLKIKAGVYLALLSHSGSRGAGEAVAEYYSALAMSLHPELPDELKHLAWLDLDSKEGQEYWTAMELMGKYASANHELIHRHILEHLGIGALGYVENHHNFAWKETYDGQELIVHRKGATPAGKGVLGIVPGSMGTPGFVVRGKGNPASFCSCSHGAGRVMSRRAAFKNLKRETMDALLKERGIRLLSGPIDESPEVYKDIEEVIAAQSDLIDTLAKFEPKIVKMAPAETDRPAWAKNKCNTNECKG
ncbi:MAG: RtcB family protein [Sutterellaceae bacterium]|nr:RtcB family protein [Sutterellaceae bacterium]